MIQHNIEITFRKDKSDLYVELIDHLPPAAMAIGSFVYWDILGIAGHITGISWTESDGVVIAKIAEGSCIGSLNDKFESLKNDDRILNMELSVDGNLTCWESPVHWS